MGPKTKNIITYNDGYTIFDIFPTLFLPIFSTTTWPIEARPLGKGLYLKCGASWAGSCCGLYINGSGSKATKAFSIASRIWKTFNSIRTKNIMSFSLLGIRSMITSRNRRGKIVWMCRIDARSFIHWCRKYRWWMHHATIIAEPVPGALSITMTTCTGSFASS